VFSERWQKFKLFWFFVLALCVGKKPKVLKRAWAFRLVANGINMVRLAFQRSNLSTYHYIS